MKAKLLIIVTVVLAACTNQVKTKQPDNENGKGQEPTETAAPLNNGSKWKADDATKKNVSEMVQVVNDRIYADAAKRKQLFTTLQTKIDTLEPTPKHAA